MRSGVLLFALAVTAPAYRYGAGSTPHLDALARDGIVFEDAYSHCP